MTTTRIIETALPDTVLELSETAGAVVRFLGVVRGTEEGTPICGIRYTAYQKMAEEILEAIAKDGVTQWPTPHDLAIVHRIGEVPVAKPSLLLEVAFPHSAEAWEALPWYLAEIKSRVPIWKEILHEKAEPRRQ